MWRSFALAPRLERTARIASLRRRMRRALGYEPDLAQPRSLNEHLACKILNDRNPMIPFTTDKVAVRDFVRARLGTEHLIPLYGVWQRADDVNWEALPDRFVIKASHGCGFNLLVPDKSIVDLARARRLMRSWLRRSYYNESGEWGYRDIPPQLLAEALLLDPDGRVPEDYKLYCFDGQPRFLQVHLDRFGTHRVLTYDPESLCPLPLSGTRHDQVTFSPPDAARALVPLARRLAAGFDAVRVDFYLVGARPYFGELTHYSGGAVVSFGSPEIDFKLGELWPAKPADRCGTPS